MEIDLQRWTRLCDEIDHLRAVGATINQQQFDLQRRRRDAANNLATVERHRRLEFGERPAPEETAETATQKVRAANAARNLAVHRKATQADADLQWFEAKASVDDIDAENTRVMARNRLLK